MIAVESVLDVTSSIDLVYNLICVFFSPSSKDADLIKLGKILQELLGVGSNVEDVFFWIVVYQSLIKVEDKEMGMRCYTWREEGIWWHF